MGRDRGDDGASDIWQKKRVKYLLGRIAKRFERKERSKKLGKDLHMVLRVPTPWVSIVLGRLSIQSGVFVSKRGGRSDASESGRAVGSGSKLKS